MFWWYLTFDDHPALQAAIPRIQRALELSEAVDLVPPEWLHLTLQEVGFVDAVPQAHVGAVCEAARHLSGLGPLELSLGPLETMHSAVVLEAGPADDLSRLRTELHRATTAVMGPSVPAHPTGGEFRPHVTLGYLNRDCEAREVLPDEARSLVEPIPRVPVRHVTLVAVSRSVGGYRWEPQGKVALVSDERQP